MKKVIKYLKGKFKRVSVYSKSNNNNKIKGSIIGSNNKNNNIKGSIIGSNNKNNEIG